MNSKLYELLRLISTDSYQTSHELAGKLGIGEKTVRTRMKELNELLKDYGAEIISKRHFGHQLVVHDEQSFLTISRPKSSRDIPDTIEDRQAYLLRKLFMAKNYLKLDDISETLFVSRNTLSATLKRVEDILSYYHLSLNRRPNHGIKIMGNEFDKRTCIVNNFFWDDMDNLEIQWLVNLVIMGNKKNQVEMSEIALDNFIKYLVISLIRMKYGYPLVSKADRSNEISPATQMIVDEYCKQIEEKFQLSFSISERQFLAIHFGSRLSSDSYSQYGPNFVITGKIDELVFKMLSRVYETFSINFRNNLELRMSLSQHLVPMDIRIRYNIPVKNPLLEMIKREYAYPYTLALTACTSLNEYYRKEIPEDEIAYIALIFALAMEKRYRTVEKKNIILVCVSGKSSSQLFKYKYRQAFGDYIHQIYECTVNELDSFDFDEQQIDYIFTTVPLNKKYSVPIYEINLFIEASDILTYRQMFENDDRSYMLDYYSTNLFIPRLKADSREEVIQKMCEHIDRYGMMPEGFYESIMKREALGQTDFGNLVALPHPYKVMTEQSFATVAILEKPIMWKNHLVQVVFLLSIGSKEDPQLEGFYEKTSSLFFNQEAINHLIQTPTFETLLEILQ